VLFVQLHVNALDGLGVLSWEGLWGILIFQQSLLGPVVDAEIRTSRLDCFSRAGIERQRRKRVSSFDDMLAVVRERCVAP